MSTPSDQTSLPTTLYHYTSLQGLLGIIGSRSLWATHISFLNDPTEYKYAFSLLPQVIDQVRVELPAKVRELLDKILPLDPATLAWNASTYVTSLSLRGDLLSQWRAYAANGTGCAIGFDSTKLIDICAAQRRIDVGPCLYDLDDQRLALGRLLLDAIEDGNNRFDYFMEYPESFKHYVMYEVYRGGSFIKNPNFFEEQEWRMVARRVRTDPDLGFRPGEGTLIPYCTIALEKPDKTELSADKGDSPIQEIVVGPAADFDRSSQSIQHFLETSGITARIQRSASPYRPK